MHEIREILATEVDLKNEKFRFRVVMGLHVVDDGVDVELVEYFLLTVNVLDATD